MNEIKVRKVYLLERTNKFFDDGTDVYVGSTSGPLRKRLSEHRRHSRVCDSKLYTRMKETGISNWKIKPLSIHKCNKEEIRGYEKIQIEKLKPDLNKNIPLRENNEKNRESSRKHYFKSLEENRYHCDACDKSFGSLENLKKHLNSLKHSYAYMNSLD